MESVDFNCISIQTSERQRKFLESYFECMIWADGPEGAHSANVLTECDLDETFFFEQCCEALAFFNRVDCYLSDENVANAGHDFWLTRNRHGTGFWDRGQQYETPPYATTFRADLMTEQSHQFGEVDIVWDTPWVMWQEENKGDYSGYRVNDFGNTVSKIINKFGTTQGK